MQAYHEKEASVLSGNKINFLKNVVDNPCTMANPHWHDSYEILFVRQGFGVQQINSKKFNFTTGSATIICPGDIHATYATSKNGCEIDVLQFSREYFFNREDLLFDILSCVIDVATLDMHDIFDSINKLANSRNSSDNLILTGNIFTLCGFFLDYSKNSTSLVKTSEFIDGVCKYIQSVDDLKLETVSRHFGYSCEHFSRKFHLELGISYKHYCEKIKMQKFLKVFDNDSRSLDEIATILGYSDASSFSRAFKRIYGLTPSAYKKLKNTSI